MKLAKFIVNSHHLVLIRGLTKVVYDWLNHTITNRKYCREKVPLPHCSIVLLLFLSCFKISAASANPSRFPNVPRLITKASFRPVNERGKIKL